RGSAARAGRGARARAARRSGGGQSHDSARVLAPKRVVGRLDGIHPAGDNPQIFQSAAGVLRAAAPKLMSAHKYYTHEDFTRSFRNALGMFATGITVVTAR